MKTVILSLVTSCILVFGAMTPSVSEAGGPNIMVFSDDADRDTVPRNNRVFNRVIHALRSQLDDKGFNVFDETAVTIKDGYAQGRVRRTDAEILDIAQSLKRPPIDVAVVFQIYASADNRGYTTKVRTRIAGRMLTVQSGKFLGEFEVKKLFNAPAACNRECILEVVGDKSRDLAHDLGDVLSVKLAHLSNGGQNAGITTESNGGGIDSGSGGVVKEYSLVFNNFNSNERMDIEEYMVIFSGYQHHRPVDCSRRRCEYWYESTINSAKLHRNIQRMLDQMSVEANVVFEGNTVRVDRITLRQTGSKKPFGEGW